MNFRRGVPADIPALSALALEAKAHWGYSIAQLEAWRDDLSVSAATLPSRPICVAEENGQPIAFAQVALDRSPCELEALWVLPAHMGKGLGKALLTWAAGAAASAGRVELHIDADPNAESFYLGLGARHVGSVPAPLAGNPARVRPQLLLRTSAA